MSAVASTDPSTPLLPDAEAGDAALAAAINAHYLAPEEPLVRELADLARAPERQNARVRDLARELVVNVRERKRGGSGIEAFLKQYDLSSQEGVILMCLAEALLRIPDDETADKLIADKIASGDWRAHLGSADSLFVNASTWGLLLTGHIMRPGDLDIRNPGAFVSRLAGRIGEPLVRAAFRQAMRIMGHQFVMGRTIEEALERSRSSEYRAYRQSFDMLGEAALTAPDAQQYYDAYRHAIIAVGAAKIADPASADVASVSVKLSALHPRYEFSQRPRVMAELYPRLESLAQLAREHGIALTIDAEESERLELSLELLQSLCRQPSLSDWHGLGIAVQAYQRRGLDLVRWVIELARSANRRLNVRLVKGAYWDSEIKRAQESGLSGYPVFTRKVNTDVSYLACARLLLAAPEAVYPQFATHNAHTVAWVLDNARELARSRGAVPAYEFQRLHGMGEELYEQVLRQVPGAACRVYAPVGSHEQLLPYLVRRLLENGANTSFVNRIVDPGTSVASIVADPVAQVDALTQVAHPRIPLPVNLYGEERRNSHGINLADSTERLELARGLRSAVSAAWRAEPLIAGRRWESERREIRNPARLDEVVGSVGPADGTAVDAALARAQASQPEWDAVPAEQRAATLLRAADLMEARLAQFVARCVREAGRTIPDAIGEVREAVDFLRYYARRAREDFAHPQSLRGVTGESNELSLHGRGVFVCISPWNFPLAIFTGQIAAALAAGNSVLAKPAEQTPLMAELAVTTLHEAGVPVEVLHFLPGDGATVGARAVADPRVAGVAFTGSTETAHAIHRSLAQRSGSIGTLIAETGGQNAMIVDSSALPEQVVLDVVQSAFNSAGQRCSALRALFVQDDIADRVLELLAGYMDELVVGDPGSLQTDVGPVIDESARQGLLAHVAATAAQAKWQHQVRLRPEHQRGLFFPPTVMELPRFEMLTREVFGPIAHVIRFEANHLDAVVDAVNASGYGLTLGIHSRIDSTVREITARARVGNIYVNRNMIGAVVGVQPFGGRGLSGTGPKAGGPYYLHRFATERTLTINTAAVGGNTTLLALDEG
jgi:RHH-type transcriptional regulator, proline utilization regulon repressor / proline dehydrogenase / delta 1-pyrroline-5-carboxylate dehydrogenase